MSTRYIPAVQPARPTRPPSEIDGRRLDLRRCEAPDVDEHCLVGVVRLLHAEWLCRSSGEVSQTVCCGRWWPKPCPCSRHVWTPRGARCLRSCGGSYVDTSCVATLRRGSPGCGASNAVCIAWCPKPVRAGWCPSCGGRRMAVRAAHWVDRVFPHVRIRQWVLTFPWARRWLLARRPELARV